MPDAVDHPAGYDAQRLLTECDVRRYRSSGPGGQHRNKTQTAVELTHRPTGVRGIGQERRSQAQNHSRALFRLRVNLALSVRGGVGPGWEPSGLWRRRCKSGRVAVNPSHEDFPAVLAEALDVISAKEMDVPAAAAALGCTASQLIKLAKAEPRALAWINQRRMELGLGELL